MRRDFIALLGGAAAAWPLAGRAQQPDRMRRISVVNVIAATDPGASPRIATFETALRRLGWAIERDLRIDYYWGWSATDADRTRVMAGQVLETRPDLVVAVTTAPVQAFQARGGYIPIVFLQVFDPVSSGIVASLSRPGGTITGFTNFEPSIAGKWLQLLKEMAPRIKKVALLFNPATAPGAPFFLQSVEAAAPAVAIKPIATPVRRVEDIHGALQELARDPEIGLIIAADIFTTNNRDLIVSLAGRHHLPAIYPFRYFVTAGGLLSYGIDSTDLFRRSASYVDLILKGAKPADLPVQQPTKFELVINLKTAKELGLIVPPTLLATADEVIE
jgi:putative tryptophan/tyrosine transport system substrate-binding protein